MAEIKTSSKVCLLDTLKTFEKGEFLTIPQDRLDLQKQSIRVKISQFKNEGSLPREVSFAVNEFDNPRRFLIVRTK